jgi:TonB family protein
MKTTPRLLAVIFVALVTGLSAQTTPLRIEQTVEARFPHALSLSPITVGEARVIVNIDANGKLIDWLVSGYTHKAFADEAVTVLKQWHYTAPVDGGQSIGIRTELRFEFEATGRVVSLMAIETPDVLIKTMGIHDALITPVCHPRELDRPIAPVAAAAPRYPLKSGAPPEGRSVMIDFYVDETGQPRMPVVVNSPYEGFANAAMGALNQWRFTTPTRAGKPVAVRVRQEFIFPGTS